MVLFLLTKLAFKEVFVLDFNHVKDVILNCVMNVETLKIVFNELYLRLTEYSRLVYSKHQNAPIEELKTAPQFSFSIKNLALD